MRFSDEIKTEAIKFAHEAIKEKPHRLSLEYEVIYTRRI